MAQSVLKNGNATIHVYKNLGSTESAQSILRDIKNYLSSIDMESKEFYSFVAIFTQENISTEKEFERKLWEQLQQIHNLDNRDWDASVSRFPEESNFSFSIAGKAFFIIGMHPESSRLSRRSPKVALIFNLHAQFEKLREIGVFEQIRDRIRKRDRKLQGNINPMVSDFGKKSEAIQYSGRETEENWRCPFNPKI